MHPLRPEYSPGNPHHPSIGKSLDLGCVLVKDVDNPGHVKRKLDIFRTSQWQDLTGFAEETAQSLHCSLAKGGEITAQ
jgi:hypothetical protein